VKVIVQGGPIVAVAVELLTEVRMAVRVAEAETRAVGEEGGGLPVLVASGVAESVTVLVAVGVVGVGVAPQWSGFQLISKFW